MTKFSLAHLTVLNLTPPEVAGVAAQAGFDMFGLRLHPVRPGEQPPPVRGDTPMRRELLSIMADTGVKMLDVEAFRLHREIDFDKVEMAFEAAAHLGASNALVFVDERDVSLAADLYARFCELASEYSLDACLEYMPWLGVHSLQGALEVIQLAKKPNARILFDALHFFRSLTPIEALAAIGPHLVNYAQVCDAPIERPATLDEITDEARHNRRFPGEGQLPIVEFVAALPEPKAGLILSPEVASRGEAAEWSPIKRAAHALQSSQRVAELASRI